MVRGAKGFFLLIVIYIILQHYSVSFC